MTDHASTNKVEEKMFVRVNAHTPLTHMKTEKEKEIRKSVLQGVVRAQFPWSPDTVAQSWNGSSVLGELRARFQKLAWDGNLL